jgi:cytochrome c5
MNQFRAAIFIFLGVGLLTASSVNAEPPRAGEQIYQTYCALCHGGGWQSAPIAFDEKEWSPRMAKGMAELLANAKKGLNAMPPMGTCMDCSDDELAGAIKEMLKF